MTNDKQTESNRTHPVITREALAQLGDGRLAYVKTIRSEEVASLFPQAPKIAPGIKLFALHAADGTPIMLRAVRGKHAAPNRKTQKTGGHSRGW